MSRNGHRRGNQSSNSSKRFKAWRTVAVRTCARSPAKWRFSVITWPGTAKPNQTVPTGLAGLPKAGSFAESAARSVASAILARLNGGEAEPNTGTGSCLVEFGDGRLSWADLDFLTGPKLTSIYHAPSVAGRAHKVQFGARRRARWFGL